VLGDSPHVLLEDDLLRWSRTDDFRESSEMRGAPMGLARRAHVLAQAKGVAARRRSRRASAATCGTSTGVRSPARTSRASWRASQRSVVTRSPACCGLHEGATTQHSGPGFVSSRDSQAPHGPASSPYTRGLAFACRGRIRVSRAPWRGPVVPKETTSAPWSWATSATAMDS
jgi:hypothetical protein